MAFLSKSAVYLHFLHQQSPPPSETKDTQIIAWSRAGHVVAYFLSICWQGDRLRPKAVLQCCEIISLQVFSHLAGKHVKRRGEDLFEGLVLIQWKSCPTLILTAPSYVGMSCCGMTPLTEYHSNLQACPLPAPGGIFVRLMAAHNSARKREEEDGTSHHYSNDSWLLRQACVCVCVQGYKIRSIVTPEAIIYLVCTSPDYYA